MHGLGQLDAGYQIWRDLIQMLENNFRENLQYSTYLTWRTAICFLEELV
jgi:hypothetical protein